ncbi:MAG TPA: hypothetical protein VIM70_11520 [Clostridium sp.]|uniref:phage lytic cycle repressor MrpR family protein n=1 Tax=Clostridium sp. TaxID=1506 RepID=UPI002F95AD73
MLTEEINDNRFQENEVTFKVDPRVKEEFLDSQISSTRTFYSYILQKADFYEFKIGKSIFNFNIEERDELLLAEFKNKTISAFQSNLSPLKKYVDFCISKNLVRHFENRFGLILPKFYDNYIDIQAVENSYIPLIKNREWQKLLVNYQDKLIIELLGLGVRGRTEKGNTLEEFINFKVTDIQWEEKLIYLTSNDGELRELYVDYYTLDLIKKTIDSGHYIFGNGLKSKKNDEGIYEKTEKGFPINETEYVFRVPGKNKFGKIDHQLIANRIQRIQSWVNAPYLNISSLWTSAIIDAAKVIKDANGELTKKDYISLNERFQYGSNEKGLDGEKYFQKTKDLINLYI